MSERTLKRIKSLLHKKSSYRPSLATLKQIEKASELTLKELMTIYDDLGGCLSGRPFVCL